MVRGRHVVASVLLLAAFGTARAGWFEIALDHDTVQASGGAHFGSDPAGRFALGGRALWDDGDDGRLGALLFGFETEPESVVGLRLGVGGEVIAGRCDEHDLAATALGVTAAYAPVALHGVYLGGRIYYAPSVLAWRAAEGFLDASARVGFRATPKIEVYAEYQVVRSDVEGSGSQDLSESVLFGFGGRF